MSIDLRSIELVFVVLVNQYPLYASMCPIGIVASYCMTFLHTVRPTTMIHCHLNYTVSLIIQNHVVTRCSAEPVCVASSARYLRNLD